MLSRIQKEISDQAGIAVASRFLIEYIAARPPVGIRPISLSVYDRLTALATNILNFGSESDIIRYELADIKFSILPSERLGAKRQQMATAMNLYRQVFTSGTISRATGAFKDNWRPPGERGPKPLLLQRIDDAAEREFGNSMTDLLDFMAEAINLGIEFGRGVGPLPLQEFLNGLSKNLKWELNKVESALALLSLRPRDDYLVPPPPFSKHDVYPWRFNRGYSYLRRPFILRERNGNQEVLWGFRYVYACTQYLERLIFNGTLKARTLEMRQLLGEINNEDGKAFNDHVAKLFASNRNLIVRRRVEKIGSQLLLGPNGSLGDVDVLVADPSNNVVSVVECKSLGGAHTPYEMWGEIQKLFHSQEGEN